MSGTARLRKLAGLAAYSDQELELLVTAATLRSEPFGTVLCRQASIASSCFILTEGNLEVVQESEAEERVLATIEPGAMVGQMALVDHGPRSATVRVSSAAGATVLEFTRDTFERLLHAGSPLAVRFQEQTALAGIRQLRAAMARLTALVGQAPSGATRPHPSSRPVLDTIRAGVGEWGVPLDDLDVVEVVHVDGIPSSAEVRSRRLR